MSPLVTSDCSTKVCCQRSHSLSVMYLNLSLSFCDWLISSTNVPSYQRSLFGVYLNPNLYLSSILWALSLPVTVVPKYAARGLFFSFLNTHVPPLSHRQWLISWPAPPNPNILTSTFKGFSLSGILYCVLHTHIVSDFHWILSAASLNILVFTFPTKVSPYLFFPALNVSLLVSLSLLLVSLSLL